MARQRQNAQPATLKSLKSQKNKRQSSETTTTSSSKSDEMSMSRSRPPSSLLWKRIKQFIFVVVMATTIIFTILGYLQTRVNTPFDDKRKVILKSGLKVPAKFWGTYRPGLYFGLKTRDPVSMVTGLMWYHPHKLIQNGGVGVRHWCDQSDNLAKYGWLEHDGDSFGRQEIIDKPVKLTTSFVKRHSLNTHGGDWTARIRVEKLELQRPLESADETVNLIWYVALDPNDSNLDSHLSLMSSSTKNDDNQKKIEIIRGYTESLDKFQLSIEPSSQQMTDSIEMSYLTGQSPIELIKETTIRGMRVMQQQTQTRSKLSSVKVILNGPMAEPHTSKVQFIAIQVSCQKLPCQFDVVFESAAVINRNDRLTGQIYSDALQWHLQRFRQRFEQTFGLAAKGFNQTEVAFAQAGLSNMLGSIGYWFGSSLVQSRYTSEPVPYWNAPLMAAAPSRSFFPRGFLWDEGFHGLLLAKWDVDLELDILGHWFDLMNIEGWIPREQILDQESRVRVPEEFILQWNTNANPPTFFLTLEFILNEKRHDLTNDRLDMLDRLYPRLVGWYNWYNSTQLGTISGTYRWRGRNSAFNGEGGRELNPKTLTSGLDDYPRASHPSTDERHLDLLTWMTHATEVLAQLASLLGRTDGATRFTHAHTYLSDNDMLIRHHWSPSRQRFADYGLHTDDVTLQMMTVQQGQQQQQREMMRQVRSKPRLRFVDAQFGYVSLFPVLLRQLDVTSQQFGDILNDMSTLLMTGFGLRSLSRDSPLFMRRNTAHDPPYWRGAIWLNLNYLAVRALHHYDRLLLSDSDISDLMRKRQRQIRHLYDRLREDLIRNVHTQYQRAGYLFEQYDDATGEGRGCKPFTGWTSLIVLIMAEEY